MANMTLSEIKAFRDFCGNLISAPEWRDCLENILNGETDFEVNNVRFIADSVIDETLADELESDRYILGCFNAEAISEATNWPAVLIKAAQKCEAFEEIGEAMTRYQIERLAEIYSSADGYWHHFNGYDFGEEEIEINGETYHVFDNH